MKAQYTNQTQLEGIAKEESWAVAELVNCGMSIDEAVEIQAESWMESPFDEENFNAPYSIAQIKPIIRAATISYIAKELYHMKQQP